MDRVNLGEYGHFAAGVSLRILGILVSLASAIVTARGLGVDGRGLLVTCTSAAQIGAQILALGMPSAVVLAVARRPALGRQAARRGLAAAAGAGLIALLLAGLLFRWHPPGWLNPAVISLSPLVAGLVAAQVLLWWCSSLTQALGAVDRLPLIETSYRVISVLWSGVALFYLRLPFAPFLGSLIAVDAICGIAWIAGVRRLAPDSAPEAAWPREWWAWSLKAYFPLALNSGLRRMDAPLLTGIAGLRATGIYSIGAQVMDTCQVAPIFLGQKAMYAFSTGREDGGWLRRLRRWLPGVVFALMVLAGLTARFWAGFLFGSEFSGAGPVILVLAPGAAALAWETVAVQEINASGFPLQLTMVWLVCFGLAAGLLLALIPPFGALGAAAAISAAHLALAVMVHRLRGKIRKAGKPEAQ